jgi:Tfp pilus assembly protein PilX
MRLTCKSYGYWLIISLSILLVLTSVVASQMELAVASSKSPYDSGSLVY